jgi:hypothetical protein
LVRTIEPSITANCIIIAPKRLKLRLSGSARKSQKRFRDMPMFKFRAVLARTQPFSSRSVRNRATNPDSNPENGQLLCNSQYLDRKAAAAAAAASPALSRLLSSCMPRTVWYHTTPHHDDCFQNVACLSQKKRVALRLAQRQLCRLHW